MTEGLLARRRVLIIEDEPLIALGVKDEVWRLDAAETTIAYNREEALQAVRLFRPDFAVLDVSLSDRGDDYEIADLLANLGVPFVFSSGHLPEELPDHHCKRPFIRKPMRSGEFVDAVAAALKN